MKRKTAYLGLFAAVAIIFGYVESLVPVFTGIPGIKLGLANLAVLFILDRYSFKEAALVSVVRILVIGFMFGNLFSILYSLAGAALSLTVMDLLKKHSGFSLIGISVAGGVTHNIGQLIVAMIVVSNTSLMGAAYSNSKRWSNYRSETAVRNPGRPTNPRNDARSREVRFGDSASLFALFPAYPPFHPPRCNSGGGVLHTQRF